MSEAGFTAGLLDPDRPASEGLSGPGGGPAGKRFDVYRNNVAVGLTEALETAFPVIRKLVGDDFFRAMAGVHLRKHPPRSPLMMFYGVDMPAFLAGFPPVAHLPYLPDVARIELALRTAYHAADAAPLTGPDLAAVPEADLPGLRFAAHPAAVLIGSRYPAASIWRANARGGRPGTGPETALVSRPGLDPEVDVLTGEQAAIAAALLGGRTLARAAELGDIGPVLGLLVSRGALLKGPAHDMAH